MVARFYECVFIARQDIAANDVHKLADRFAEIFKEYAGSLVKKEYWGLRSLGYIINKNKKGHYMMLGVKASSEAIKEFERNCKINEDILKYMSIGVEKFDDMPSSMMQAPAKATPGVAASEDDI